MLNNGVPYNFPKISYTRIHVTYLFLAICSENICILAYWTSYKGLGNETQSAFPSIERAINSRIIRMLIWPAVGNCPMNL